MSLHILYLDQYFGTRAGVGGTRSYEFARHLVSVGHMVTIVTARRADSGIADAPVQVIDGMSVVTLGGRPYSNRLGTRARLVEFARFTTRASFLRDLHPTPDVVIASSTPLTIGIPGILLARRYHAPFVFEVRDLWPRAPIEMGVLRGRFAIGLARRLERWIYGNAQAIITLSPGMQEGVLECAVAPKRVVVIPNASDVDLFGPERRDRALLERWAIDHAFVAVHAGTLGRANGLDYLIDAAAHLARRRDNDIRFLILGDGGMRSKLESRVTALGLDNVIFGGGISRDDVGAIVSSCDVSITSFANVPVLATNSPNKFFDGLAAGIPVIVNSPGWTRDLVVDRDAGVYVDPARPVQLAEALIRLRENPKLRDRQGHHARELATTMFSRTLMAERFRSVIEDVAKGAPVGLGEIWTNPSVSPPE